MSAHEDAEHTAMMAKLNTRASLYAEERLPFVRRQLALYRLPADDAVREEYLALELVRAWMEGNLHGLIWSRENAK